jgi:integrase
MFDAALEYDLIDSNPVRCKLHRPAVGRSTKESLKLEHLRKLMDLPPGEDRTILLTFMFCGLRIGEFRALMWRAIDFDEQELKVTQRMWRNQLGPPKTETSQRIIWIPDALLFELEIHRSRSLHTRLDDYVFCREDGRAHTQEYLRNHVLNPALDTIGIKRRPYAHGFHLFRHTATTLLEELTGELREAQKLMSHAYESTTRGYSHNKPKTVRASQTIADALLSSGGLLVAQDTSTIN